FPFLDMNLVQFARALPDSLRLSSSGISKWVLKESIKNRLPESVLARPKMGFSVPVDKLLQKLRGLVLDVVNAAGKDRISDILRLEAVRERISNFYRFNAGGLQAWSLFCLLYWHLRVVPAYRRPPERSTARGGAG